MAYLAVPPPERTGKPWLYVSSSVRPATTFDIQDGEREALALMLCREEYEEIVAAQSRALEALSREVAEAVKKLPAMTSNP